jgi:hypothetical protein
VATGAEIAPVIHIAAAGTSDWPVLSGSTDQLLVSSMVIR